MNDNVDNLVLEHLKRIQAEQTASRERDQEMLSRLATLESGVASLRRDSADTFADRVNDRHTVDRLAERVAPIERRLERND